MLPGNQDPEDIAETLLNEADEDMSADDLVRGTEVYEEYDEEVDEDGSPAELDLEPGDYSGSSLLDFEDIQDAYISEDDY